MVDPLSYFSLASVLHNWCNKGCGMSYPVWGGAYKKPLLLMEREAHVVAAGFLSHYLNGPLPYV